MEFRKVEGNKKGMKFSIFKKQTNKQQTFSSQMITDLNITAIGNFHLVVNNKYSPQSLS